MVQLACPFSPPICCLSSPNTYALARLLQGSMDRSRPVLTNIHLFSCTVWLVLGNRPKATSLQSLFLCKGSSGRSPMGTCTLTVKITGLGPGHCADSFREHALHVTRRTSHVTSGAKRLRMAELAHWPMGTCYTREPNLGLRTRMVYTPRSRVAPKPHLWRKSEATRLKQHASLRSTKPREHAKAHKLDMQVRFATLLSHLNRCGDGNASERVTERTGN